MSPTPLSVPNHLKRGGVKDETSAAAGLEGFDLIARALGVDRSWYAGKTLLDVGCGNRMAEAVIAYAIPLRRYVGIDNAKKLIDVMAPQVEGTNVELIHVPVYNQMYANEADRLARDYRLPVEGAYDIIHAWSLFSHLNADDTDAYFHILRKHLAPGGVFTFTAFLEDISGWRDSDPDRPLLRVRYGPLFLEKLLSEAGWAVSNVYSRGHQSYIGASLAKPSRCDGDRCRRRRSGSDRRAGR